MINAFGVSPTIATKYEAMIGECMIKCVKSEKKYRKRKQVVCKPSFKPAFHRKSDLVCEAVFKVISASSKPLTRAEISPILPQYTENCVRYATEKLKRLGRIEMRRQSKGFNPLEFFIGENQ